MEVQAPAPTLNFGRKVEGVETNLSSEGSSEKVC